MYMAPAMTFFRKSFRWSFIVLCLSLQGYILFSAYAFYQVYKVPAEKYGHPRSEILLQTNVVVPKTSPVPDQPLLTILLWTWPSNHTFPLNQCPPHIDSSGCFFTVNRSMYSEANAVVIHHRDIRSQEQLPPTPRPSNHYWIWFNMEPPEHLSKLNLMDNMFNLTMSYRADSDIFTPYGWLERNDKMANFKVPQKSKLVTWIVSNWKPKQERVKYYNELKEHLPIDVYGKHNEALPRKNHFLILKQYKFYLAFENSIHKDYITEKLWYNAFHAEAIPIVLGPPRKNYERYIPPDSFIHVDDFSSARELATYILSVDKDEQRYRQYFNWRALYTPSPKRKTWISEYCKVCKALKEAPPFRTIPSIAQWFQ